jgi:hypothetical protein
VFPGQYASKTLIACKRDESTVEMDRLTTLAVCFLVVLGGCSALTGPGPQTPTDGPTPTTTPAPTGGLPPGVSPDGIVNESALLASHQAALATDSYRIRYELQHAAGRSFVNTSTIIASNLTQRQLIARSYLPGRTVVEYYNNTERVSQTTVGNSTETTTGTINASFKQVHTSNARPGPLLKSVLSSANYEQVEQKRVNGQQLYRYNATSIAENTSERIPNTVSRFNGTVTINQNGRIQHAFLVVGGHTNGTNEVMLQEYRTLTTNRVRIETPAWATEGNARNQIECNHQIQELRPTCIT